MEQRIKAPIEIEKDKDLEWDFDDHSVSNHSKPKDDFPSLTKEEWEELGYKTDPSLREDPYCYTKEEWDTIIEEYEKDLEEGTLTRYTLEEIDQILGV